MGRRTAKIHNINQERARRGKRGFVGDNDTYVNCAPETTKTTKTGSKWGEILLGSALGAVGTIGVYWLFSKFTGKAGVPTAASAIEGNPLDAARAQLLAATAPLPPPLPLPPPMYNPYMQQPQYMLPPPAPYYPPPPPAPAPQPQVILQPISLPVPMEAEVNDDDWYDDDDWD